MWRRPAQLSHQEPQVILNKRLCVVCVSVSDLGLLEDVYVVVHRETAGQSETNLLRQSIVGSSNSSKSPNRSKLVLSSSRFKRTRPTIVVSRPVSLKSSTSDYVRRPGEADSSTNAPRNWLWRKPKPPRTSSEDMRPRMSRKLAPVPSRSRMGANGSPTLKSSFAGTLSTVCVPSKYLRDRGGSVTSTFDSNMFDSSPKRT